MPHKQTVYVKLDVNNIDYEKLHPLVDIIRQGGVIAFPTETVYGLGANAFDGKAINKIFVAKGRPADNPLIVHISNMDMLKRVAAKIPANALKAAEAFWPGPLTIVVPRAHGIPNVVTAGLDSVGVRMPDNKIALALIAEADLPIAAPSANISGKPSPTTAQHVSADMAGKIDAIIDGGSSSVGLESTVVDFTGEIPIILRPGGITKEDLTKVLEEIDYDKNLINPRETPRSPGMKYTHYSPDADLVIIEGDMDKVKGIIIEMANGYQGEGKRVGIIATEETKEWYSDFLVISMGSRIDLEGIAAALFSTLRRFDEIGVDIILTESFENKGIGVALMNRLKKAAGFRVIKV